MNKSQNTEGGAVSSTVSSSVKDSGNQCSEEAADSNGDDSSGTPVLDFSEPFLFSDIILEVENESFHCHRAILSMWSPVFKAMFTSKFQESSSNKIVLSKEKGNEIRELLKQIYTPGGRDMDTEMAHLLLPIVNRYQIDCLLETVERRLTSSLNDHNVATLLSLADLYTLRNLSRACLERCARLDLVKLDRQVVEVGLPPDIHLDAYRHRIMFLEHCVTDIQRSFLHSCIKMESKLERVPANHCREHSKPLSQTEAGEPCGPCLDNLKVHIGDLCKRALNKTSIVVMKD